MTPAYQHAIATLLTWIGLLGLLRAVALGVQFAFGVLPHEKAKAQRGLAISLVVGAVALLVGALLPTHPNLSAVEGAWRLPLAWPVMPAVAWIAVASVIMIVARLFQGYLGLSVEERKSKRIAAAIWAVVLVGSVWLYQQDKDNKVTWLTGGIPLTPRVGLSLAALAVGTTFVMAWAARSAATRAIAFGFANQIALLIGSVIFGIPFAFLLITSFKEDIDMSSPNGIVWVPKVTETVPYMDPANPLYEGTFKNQTVRGYALETRPDGTIRIDIFQPVVLRGTTFDAPKSALKEVPKKVPLVTVKWDEQIVKGMVVQDLDDGKRRVVLVEPAGLKGQQRAFSPGEVTPIRNVGLKIQNYPDALDYLPPETNKGLQYLENSVLLVVLSVLGTCLSSSLVAYAFSRLVFPGRDALFVLLLSTMMLPGAVTLMPQFLIFRNLGWIDTLLPLWVPSFFASAFNVFLLRQFFMSIPMELEDAAKIDGCTYVKTFWAVMMPQIKPALAVIAIWTFMGSWNNFMGPLIYISSPEHMPLSYALQLFQGERGGEPGLLMAFATMSMMPVLLLFFFAQRYFIDGVTLSGMGGR